MSQDLARADALLHCPTNLSLPPGTGIAYVDADMYDICERVKEISPDIKIVAYDNDGSKYTHGICEDTPSKLALIFKVGPACPDTPVLDGRVISKLRRLLAVPLDERLKLIEKEEAKYEADCKENELEELYETMGRPMWTQLEHDGFITRPVSYPKVGVASPGKAR